MKKFIAILFVALTIGTAQAKEIVTIIYAFSPADTMANYSRTLADEANKLQDKYTFIFDTKAGAGNAIAAQYVARTPNTILATSSAFFVRPNFYPNESYDINNYRELMPQCDAPLGVASTKYKSWKDVPKDQRLTIGVSGLGVTTHLTATQVAVKYPNLAIVPFKSTNDSILSMVGGFTDIHVGFLGESETWGADTSKNKVYVLGTTGDKIINKHPTLVSQGFPTMLGRMNAPHHLVIPNSVPEAKSKEWRDILVRAAKTKSVRGSYAVDHCDPLSDMDDDRIQPWFHAQAATWKKLSSGVKLEYNAK